MTAKWEYKILDDVTEEDLNALASEGWELVAATSTRADVRLNDELTDEVTSLVVNGVARRPL
jgi:hypothetical protein